MKWDMPCGESKSSRSQTGSYLIELLMAIAMAGMIAAALAANIAETMRLMNTGHNELVASNMTQQLLDTVRHKHYGTLEGLKGQHKLKLYDTDPLYTSCPVDGPTCKLNPRSLLADEQNLSWTSMYSSHRGVRFPGRAQVTISEKDIAGEEALQVEVDISWLSGHDSQGQQVWRNHTANTVIFRSGITNL